ncbi:MAG: DUF4870 domain-containing protein [Spirochaetaceae bacterium]
MKEELKLNIGTDGKVILPQPADLSKREKEDSMGAYLMMFAAMGAGLPLPLLNLLASFIYYQINKKKSRYVAFHSFQSLITQLPISIVNGGLVFWLIKILIQDYPDFTSKFFTYLAFAVIWNLLYLVLSIRACICARRGQLYYMFLFGGVSFNRFYGEDAKDLNTVETVPANSPPPGY